MLGALLAGGLLRGDLEAAMEARVGALFMPHGEAAAPFSYISSWTGCARSSVGALALPSTPCALSPHGPPATSFLPLCIFPFFPYQAWATCWGWTLTTWAATFRATLSVPRRRGWPACARRACWRRAW